MALAGSFLGGRGIRRDCYQGGRLEQHISRALAVAGGVGENALSWIQKFLAEMKQMFSDWMINIHLKNMIDGNMLNRSMGKYQLKKVSVFKHRNIL